MNINHSILLSMGYGLISTSKLSESITHHKSSIGNLSINGKKTINIGFVTNNSKLNINRRYLKSSPEDSSNLNNNSETDFDVNYDIGKKFESLIEASNKAKTNNQLESDLDKINLNEDLYKLISAHSEIIKKDGDKDDLQKYDWFNDEAIDSSDEELITEYYETKLPDYKTIYKNLDPVGLRDYVDEKNLSDGRLGRVYEVGKSLLEDKKHTNVHSFEEVLEKAKEKKLELIEAEKQFDQGVPIEEIVQKSMNKTLVDKSKMDLKDCCLDDDKELMEKYERLLKKRDEIQEDGDEYVEQYEGVDEFDFGEEFKEDSEDIVMEDEMCRFILEVPIRKWVKDEAKAFENSLLKLEKSNKYYRESEKEKYVTDFRKIFTESPLTTLGIFDNDDNNENNLDKIYDSSNSSSKNEDKDKLEETETKENEEKEEQMEIIVENILNTTLSKKRVKDLYIKEYKHSDLLNDIDKYEKSKYPDIILAISENDKNQPVFVLDKEDNENIDMNSSSKNQNTDKLEQSKDTEKLENKEVNRCIITNDLREYNLDGNLRVYLGVPKNFIKFDDVDSVVISDSAVFRRSYDVYSGRVIEKVPLVEEYHTAAVILPNQAGYMDQNIRYLADELAVNSKGLVFVPDIPVVGKENKEWYFIYLNRLLKMIQSVYKVDRISFVALGDQGNLILDYISHSMDKTISYYKSLYESSKQDKNKLEETENKDTEDTGESNKDKEGKVDKLDRGKKDKVIEFLEKFSTERAQELIRRQSIPLIEDLLNGLENIKLSQSHQLAQKAKDVNFIKPISKMLQSVVLYDTCNIDFEKLVSLSIPTLVIQSNRTNLMDGILSSSEERFVKTRYKKPVDPKYEGISMFNYAVSKIPEKLKELIDKQTTFRFIPSQENLKNRSEQYYITSFHKGIDIILHIFKEASPHFYMKKPNSPELEYQAFKDSLVCCANWITSWSY